MLVYVIRRLLQSMAIIFTMSLLVFMGVNVIGNPVDLLISSDCTQACYDEAVKSLGLDLPIWQQYFHFIHNAVRGELGNSFMLGVPAMELIIQRLPATLELAFMAVLLSVVIGVPLGMWAAFKNNTALSRLIMSFSILGFSLPTFWVGILLIMVFSVQFDLLPAFGRGETVNVFGIDLSILTLNGLAHIILPALNLALYKMSLIIRLSRASTLEVMHLDYIKFARAKGVRHRRIILLHVLKNISIPIITVLGLELGSVIAFAIVTETIFSWPGMGKLLIDSIRTLDRPVIVAYLMITVFVIVLINFLVDIVSSYLDPRVRLYGTSK